MADPVTVNRGYAVPVRGTDAGTWDTPINGDFNLIDQNLGAVSSVALSNANVTLTPTQYACGTIRLTGALTGSVSVIFPAVQAWWTIDNQTTGTFVATISIGSGQVIAVEQGTAADIFTDGTNVKFRNLPPVGTYLDICDATVPAWISACTIPPYLNCDGTTFNATTYPYLNTKLGGNALPDMRGVTRYTLNQGTSRLTNAVSGLDGNTRFAIKTTQANTIGTANLPPYTPSGNVTVFSTTGDITRATGGITNWSNGTGLTFTAFNPGGAIQAQITSTGSLSGNAQGGSSTPFGSVATGTVSGITLIRAA